MLPCLTGLFLRLVFNSTHLVKNDFQTFTLLSEHFGELLRNFIQTNSCDAVGRIYHVESKLLTEVLLNLSIAVQHLSEKESGQLPHFDTLVGVHSVYHLLQTLGTEQLQKHPLRLLPFPLAHLQHQNFAVSLGQFFVFGSLLLDGVDQALQFVLFGAATVNEELAAHVDCARIECLLVRQERATAHCSLFFCGIGGRQEAIGNRAFSESTNHILFLLLLGDSRRKLLQI